MEPKSATLRRNGVATAKQNEYWRRNLRLTAVLLGIWFVATFVVIYFARELNGIVIMGFPFAFFMGAQGSLIIYVLIIWFYARRMNQLDQEYGVHEGEY
jgi:putative solute:sodium symporter small subunit